MIEGNLDKMAVEHNGPARYTLRLSEHRLALNDYLGKRITLTFNGVINCTHCGRVTKKSFSQGYCYPCSQKLAECDMCIVRPEQCHYDQGTCRDATWAQQHCFMPHVVYLANSAGIKVGITRASQIPTRWLDQGAEQAIPMYRVANRYQSGLLEVVLKAHVADRTDWRKMLKGAAERVDLVAIRDALYEKISGEETALRARFGEAAIMRAQADAQVTLAYPVQHYPDKVTSLGFDKTAAVAGVLEGIKGQYLLLDSGVINLRKHTGYHIAFSGDA